MLIVLLVIGTHTLVGGLCYFAGWESGLTAVAREAEANPVLHVEESKPKRAWDKTTYVDGPVD